MRSVLSRSARRELSILPVLLSLCAVIAFAACGQGGDPLVRARQAYRLGDRISAIGHYQRYLEDHAEDYDVRKEYTLTLGEEWAYAGGDRAPIIEELDWLYEQRASDEVVQGLLSTMLISDGQAAAESERYEDAEAAFIRAMAVNPAAGHAQYYLGMLYEDWGRSDDAFAQYRSAAAKSPEIPDLYLRLGGAYLDRGDNDRAISYLEIVPQLQISSYLIPEAHCLLARAYFAEGLEDEAIEHLDRAVEGCMVEGLR